MAQTFKTNQRSRSHFVRTYVSKEQLELFLEKNLSIIYRYAYVLHDKDKKEDGTCKVPHYHIWIKFTQPRSTFNVEQLFSGFVDVDNKLINTESQITLNDFKAQRYLMHLDDVEKYQYPLEDITYYNVDFEKCLDFTEVKTSKGAQIVADLVEGVPISTILNRYGDYYILNAKKFIFVAQQIREEKALGRCRILCEDYTIINNKTGETYEYTDIRN